MVVYLVRLMLLLLCLQQTRVTESSSSAASDVYKREVGSRHLEHAQKGGGGTTNAFHTRDELHRIPDGLCADVVRWCERVTAGHDIAEVSW